jgi:hypothetical protein
MRVAFHEYLGISGRFEQSVLGQYCVISNEYNYVSLSEYKSWLRSPKMSANNNRWRRNYCMTRSYVESGRTAKVHRFRKLRSRLPPGHVVDMRLYKSRSRAIGFPRNAFGIPFEGTERILPRWRGFCWAVELLNFGFAITGQAISVGLNLLWYNIILHLVGVLSTVICYR